MIALGSKVRDKMTGYEGIANSRHFDYTGQIQIGIQPPVAKDKPGELPDPYTFDEADVEFVAAGMSAQAVSVPTEFAVKLGEIAEDVITGYRGVVVRRSEFMNGCVNFILRAKGKADKEPPQQQAVSHFALKRIGVGISKTLPKPVAVKVGDPPKRAPGGPAQRLERA